MRLKIAAVVLLLAAGAGIWLIGRERGSDGPGKSVAWKTSLQLDQAADGGRLVLASRKNGLYALDSNSGAVHWTYQSPHTSVRAVPVADSHLVLLASYGTSASQFVKATPSQAIVLRASTGDELAHSVYTGTLLGLNSSDALVTYADRTLTVTSMSMFAERTWEAPDGCTIDLGNAAAPGGIAVMLICSDRNELAFLDRASLTPRWTRTLPKSEYDSVDSDAGRLLVRDDSTLLVLDEKNRVLFTGSGEYAHLLSAHHALTLAVRELDGSTSIHALDGRPGRRPLWTVNLNSAAAVFQDENSVLAVREDDTLNVSEVTRFDAHRGTVRSSHLVAATTRPPLTGNASLIGWTRSGESFVGDVEAFDALDEHTGAAGRHGTDACRALDGTADEVVRGYRRLPVPDAHAYVSREATACAISRGERDDGPLLLAVMWTSGTATDAEKVMGWFSQLERARLLPGGSVVVREDFGVCDIGVARRGSTLYRAVSCAKDSALERVLEAVAA